MITTDVHQRPPYIYGEILSRSIYITRPSALPPLGRFLSQGVAAAACMVFLNVAIAILSEPTNGYNFVFIFALPIFLALGMIFGLVEGFVIWGCTRLTRHRLSPVVRTSIGMVLWAIVMVVWWWQFRHPVGTESFVFADYLWYVGSYLTIGAAVGLVTGSELQPWRELVRGAKELPSRAGILTGITGVILRVLVVWFLMESTLTVIYSLQGHVRQYEVTFSVLAFAHFAAAVAISFARLKFWLLLPLALLINIPAVVVMTDVVPPDMWIARYIIAGYLGLWALFLITRFKLTYSALSALKAELHYYLFD